MTRTIKIQKGYEQTDKTKWNPVIELSSGEYVIGYRTASDRVEYAEFANSPLDAKQRIGRLVEEDKHFCQTLGSEENRWKEVFALNHNGRVCFREKIR